MSKMNFSKGKFSRFLSSKGFYVALAVCLVGASAATWVAVSRTITGIENSNNRLIENETQHFEDFPMLEEAETNVPDVPRQYSPPSSSFTTPEPSSETSTEPEEPSSVQTNSGEVQTLAYALPVRGTITNPFSNGELVKNVTLGDWRTHDGIDIECNKGDDILAVADGVVTYITQDPLWGAVVTISHPDGHESIYSGLDSNLPIKVGDTVTMRQAIGRLDGIPAEIEQSSHLHFAMKLDGTWIDPLSVIAKAEED